MKKFLFSTEGRIRRGQFWKGVILTTLGFMAISAVLNIVVGMLSSNQATESGEFSVSGAAAIPFFIANGLLFIPMLWSSICLGVKRLHDRDKPGVWMLIMFVPFIGPLWYLIETGFLKGTTGPNTFGPDPMIDEGAAISLTPAR